MYYEQVQAAASIFYRAAFLGNIQTVINGFKLYPSLLNELTLNDGLRPAARGGHEVIIDLFLDLGATNTYSQIVMGAIDGGHLNLITGAKYQALHKPIQEYMYVRLGTSAIQYRQLTSLKYLFSLPEYQPSTPNSLIKHAGEAGDSSIVDYLISFGANDYADLVLGAMQGHNFDLVVKYLAKARSNKWLKDQAKYFVPAVIRVGRLDILDLLVKFDLVSLEPDSPYFLPG
jgi:hypothetical protein